MLAKLAPAKVPEGSVEVVSWVERNGNSPELVVTLVPKGQVKLVADPGVTVTPIARDGIAWIGRQPDQPRRRDQGYFAEPPTVRVPFAREDGRPVEARWSMPTASWIISAYSVRPRPARRPRRRRAEFPPQRRAAACKEQGRPMGLG